ncbi:alpha/beta fold hydrolase [Pseudonocardia alaniniphila]|uniref:Alpha/beta hydrolase n=1 Tax=Pseudonocardia alaniniphila TaxID=75291 RepID=A0ABS9T759_9PSEU|nr:alpha/beta hydrolase [Pseudonocardia alaniniphila]MCH6164273.1 alpha/beta hydrolase [Pseudonocardia alaniniphila]
MSTPTTSPRQVTAPNLHIEAGNGITYAYRRFGSTGPETTPLLFLQHFRGNLDNWDPLLIDAIAAEREVILLDNTGVGGSSGRTPSSVTAMARDALAFVDALGLRTLDILGFCLGGFVAQKLTLIRPQLVRRLVLAGTGPQGGEQMHGYTPDVLDAATPDEPTGEDFLYLFFERTPTSVGKGWDAIDRICSRTHDRDEPTSLQTRDAQLDAVTAWGIPDPTRLHRLAGIGRPTLVANGDCDILIPTRNSRLLASNLQNATLSIYPNAGHGFLFQYPTEFAAEVNTFLG